MPTNVFSTYNKNTYLDWHKEQVDNDCELEAEVVSFRQELKDNSSTDLNSLGQLLSQIKAITEPECKLQSGGLLTGEFFLPLGQISQNSDVLYKSEDSIIEKLWRKNSTRNSNYVGLTNLQQEINDLVRTSVVCPTLQQAKMYSERLEAWMSFIPEDARNQHFSEIVSVEVDKEAKAASGYFAYHSLVRFKSGLVVEVQLYSQLSSAWRNLSHVLYEKSRVGNHTNAKPGSADARMVSLGHMLHLAECELDRLVDEFKPK
ncbi:hypothetical protein [Vibrio sp. V15_P4S5T153]|uniref:hypothetical protein n=1 Tax=Vibrio sp. V15_P4S5T153 TaxID=1938669 RepID=UPI0015963545|nr:hypothetical protein [Vibrio sp. V15_P4S5T153]